MQPTTSARAEERGSLSAVGPPKGHVGFELAHEQFTVPQLVEHAWGFLELLLP
jgi:hypothetical protein